MAEQKSEPPMTVKLLVDPEYLPAARQNVPPVLHPMLRLECRLTAIDKSPRQEYSIIYQFISYAAVTQHQYNACQSQIREPQEPRRGGTSMLITCDYAYAVILPQISRDSGKIRIHEGGEI